MLWELSVAEQRYRAVLEVGIGVPVTEVAERYGVSRQSVHTWLVRYRQEDGSSSCSGAATASNSSAHDRDLPASRGYAGPCGPQHRSSSHWRAGRCMLPRHGTGVPWQPSPKPAAHSQGDRPAGQPALNALKCLLAACSAPCLCW
jgi:hypothetical protein